MSIHLLPNLARNLASVLAALLALTLARAASLPVGFAETDIATVNNPVGIAFGKNSSGQKERTYIWDRWGSIWIVEDGQKLDTPLIALNEEVADYGDYGLLGVALDPDFQVNGYIYCLYIVDRHHLLYSGTAQYSATANIRSQATIGRLTRYTCRRSDDFRSVDPASRKILLGETMATGVPILHTSHGVGSVVFATDGSLMVSCGDGASFQALDAGGTNGGAYGPQSLTDGIITPSENIGAFRCQLLTSLSGKVLRLDPATGDGISSNPYFDPASPRSAQSRIWSRGLRNPCRMTLKPGTGSHEPALGNPGTFYIGDVGWKSYEELNIARGPAANFGWPDYEGMNQNSEYWPRRPAGLDATDHQRPAVDWQHGGGSRAFVNGTVYKIGAADSPATGSSFGGNAACGGVWYNGTDFPAEWRNIYFQSDFSGQWIRAFTMDDQDQLVNARSFAGSEPFVFLATHPRTGGLYYCAVESGSSKGRVRRISWAPGGNRPPAAIASVDHQYGVSPLTVQFSSALSSDPENSPLTWSWNFGDGTTSTEANPLKTYTATGPKRFDALLTVTDAGGATASSAIIITVNNTPPAVEITSPAPDSGYPLDQGAQTWNLTANVTDAEHLTTSLTHQWQVNLIHDNHEHIELAVSATSSQVTLDPLGNDPDSTYYYRITLRVTDPLGLTTVAEQLFLPLTGAAPVVVNPDYFTVSRGGGQLLDVLANDHGAVTDADWSTLQIVTPPAFGTATPDPVSGKIRYLHNGSATAADTFSYQLRTRAGTLSPVGTVSLVIAAAAANHAPVALGDNATVGPGQSTLISVLGNDIDPGGALVPSSLVILEHPSAGQVSVNNGTGAVTYTHNGSARLTDRFTYSVADAGGLRSEPATVRVTVSSANGAPALISPGSQSSVRGAPVSLALSAADPNGQPLTWSAAGLPAGLSIHPATGLISGTIATGATGSTVTVTVSDGILTDAVTFSWAITAPATGNGLLGEYFDGLTPGVNPPLLTRNDATLNFDWPASPGLGVPADNFSVRWSGELLPLYSELYNFALPVDNGVRVWIDNVLVVDKWLPVGTGGWHNFTASLTAGKRTPFRVEYYEQWGGAGIILYWFSTRQAWEVIPASAFIPAGGAGDSVPPAVTISGSTGTVTGPFTVSVSFSEQVTDLSAGDFAITNGSASLLESTGGAYTLTVNPSAAGNVRVSLPAGRCFDGAGNGNADSNLFVVTYAPPANRPPAVSSPGNQTSVRGAITSLQMQGSDPDGNPLTWSASGLPSGLAINTATGLIAGTISLSAAPAATVTVTARDPAGLTASAAFTWNTLTPAGSGLRGEYFAGLTPGNSAPLLTRYDAGINFDWGAASPGGSVPADQFSVRWTGELIPAWTERYTFTISGDNGYRLWINNTLVIDNWLPVGTGGWKTANVNLTAGQRTAFRMEYYDEWGGAAVSLFWNSARQPWEAIPADRFVPPAASTGGADTLLAAVSANYAISRDPAGGTVITFSRPLTTGSTAMVVEASTDLLTWAPADIAASVSRTLPGSEDVRIQVLAPPHLHPDGTVHVHDNAPADQFFRVRLIEQ